METGFLPRVRSRYWGGESQDSHSETMYGTTGKDTEGMVSYFSKSDDKI